jgi:hypothetical protein
LAGVLAVCLAVVAPASASAFEKTIWGPTELPAGSPACPSRTEPCSAFPIYRDLGVDALQFQLHWNEVAPTRPAHPRDPNDPAYRWGAVDSLVSAAIQGRVGLAAQVSHTPPWANGGRPSRWAPNRPRAYADFLIAAARRYPTIHRWMIWGEPSRAENFQPMRPNSPAGPRRYALILDRAYAALKGVSRRNRVIGGMTFSAGTIYPNRFLHWLKLPNGRPPRMDLWGHNPFDGRYPRLAQDPVGHFRGFNDLDTLHLEIKRVYREGHRKVPRIWISEFTLSDTPTPIFRGFHVSRREQAARLSAAFTIARRTGYVAAFGWFTLLDQQPGEGTAGWGLLDASGNPKPSYATYRRLR